MSEQKFIIPHKGKITKHERRKLMGHGSAVIWLTGLSGSGKSTIAHELDERLYKLGVHSYVLDGDNVRRGLNKDLGFSKEDRAENIRRVGEVAKLFVDAGLIVITAFISPYKKDRSFVRSLLEDGEFIEVYVSCPIEVCQKRDPKGLYRKALEGEIKNFTGVSDPYEPPDNPEIVVQTDKMSVQECVDKIISYLKDKGIVRRDS